MIPFCYQQATGQQATKKEYVWYVFFIFRLKRLLIYLHVAKVYDIPLKNVYFFFSFFCSTMICTILCVLC